MLVFGYSEATYTSYTRISSLHNKLACGYFLIKWFTHSHQLREIRIQLSIILKASITPATRVLPLLALTSMPSRGIGSSSSMARNSRHAHWSVSASILARCLPSSFQDASTFLATECLSSSSKVFYFQGTKYGLLSFLFIILSANDKATYLRCQP